MKEIFGSLYGKIESDEFLSHFVKSPSCEYEAMEKCFYYFLMEDYPVLSMKLASVGVKVTMHEFYLLK